jgi:ribose 5-phosphate isomerase B
MNTDTHLSNKVSIGCDHAGYELKNKVSGFLKEKGFSIIDKGTYSSESVDYPDFAHQVADSVSLGETDWGILICGSANGVAITANKHQKIRAAICWKSEIASLARQHNNANVICLPARFVSVKEALEMVELFYATEFEGGRHAKRVDKIMCN